MSAARLPIARSQVADGEPRGAYDDWRWQLRNTLRTAQELHSQLGLTPAELAGAQAAEAEGFPIAVTPYYLSLASRSDPTCPIRRQVVPVVSESQSVPGDLVDPLGEEAHLVAPNLIRRYPDRALLLVTDHCAIYCRFCTRSRLVGGGEGARSLERLRPALQYLREHPEVRDVILSGGDPLAMGSERLTRVVRAVRAIESVETIRLATRVPVALPQRITHELLQALRPLHPLWVMTHFNHPREVTSESAAACTRLTDAGFPVMNQTVLLRGINDDPSVLADLFRRLVRVRVRPYYLLQADPVRGTGHLRTPLWRSIEIAESLQGRLSGIALPKLIVDTPGGHGKVPVTPEYIIERRAGVTRFRAPDGTEVDYLDPPEA